jgi:hypothetical protein
MAGGHLPEAVPMATTFPVSKPEAAGVDRPLRFMPQLNLLLQQQMPHNSIRSLWWLSTPLPPYLPPGSKGRGGAREAKGRVWRESGRERSGG